MSDRFTWTCLDANGQPVTGAGVPTTEFPTQADAETWFAESWHELPELGVEAVTLMREGEVVYGPMSLHPQE